MEKTNFKTYVVIAIASLIFTHTGYAASSNGKADKATSFSSSAAAAKAAKTATSQAAGMSTSFGVQTQAEAAAMSTATSQGKNGYVANNSGTQNYVVVGDDGSITITPVKGTDGKYTTSLNQNAMFAFLRTQSAFTCLNVPVSSGSGGGGGGGGGSDYTTYSRNGVTWTEHNGTNYDGVCQGNCGSGDHQQTGNSGSYGGSSSSSSSSSSGGSSSVICTHFYRRKRMPGDLWRADLEYTINHLSKTTVRGYHTWGIRSVELMRRHPWTEPFFEFLAINRAEEIGYQLGIRNNPNYKGKMIRMIMEPLCFLIGILAPQQNWQKVHSDFEIQNA